MKVIFFTDCMSIGPSMYDSKDLYPALIKNVFQDIDTTIIAKSGATLTDSLLELDKIISLNADVIIFAYGVNDALPRGLKRSQRSKLIKIMYDLKLNDKQRLVVRRYILNPIEYIFQKIFGPVYYTDPNEFSQKYEEIIKLFKHNFQSVVCINISPVENYRFVNANKMIEVFNKKINYIANLYKIEVVDAYKLFNNNRHMLAEDKFHYGISGHEIVANELIKILNKLFNEDKNA